MSQPRSEVVLAIEIIEELQRRAVQAEADLCICQQNFETQAEMYYKLETERDELRAALSVLAEYAGIGTDKPPEHVFEFFRKLHGLDPPEEKQP